jgi:transposase
MANHAAKRLQVRANTREALDELMRRATTPQRSALRARVILAAADGLSNAEISRRVGVARQNVIEIRRRFEERGLESVLEDSPRSGRPAFITPKTVEKIVETTMNRPPKNASHWSSRSLANEFGVGRSTV